MIAIVVNGIHGRMGQLVAAEVEAATDLTLVAGTSKTTGFAEIEQPWDVIVDFSTPVGTRAALLAALEHRTPLVTGVTGLPPDLTADLATAARHVPIMAASNFSMGVSVLLDLLPAVVRSLPESDIELVEVHHRQKRDAPSGTAESMLSVIEAARAEDITRIHGRTSSRTRAANEIGVHSIRAGGNAGEHTVILADSGEEIRITHRALDRSCFARGATAAARWIVAQPPGLYGIRNVIA